MASSVSGPSLDILSIRARQQRGEWTSTHAVSELFGRLNGWPDRSVWTYLIPRDRLEAQFREVEQRVARGEPQPLAGVPFAVKDNIDVAGCPTTAACPDFTYHPHHSATAVQRLCDAGAIVVGKTNLDQFATGLVGTRSPYGACRSVFNDQYISGGSSSGSAVAVAAGLVSFALGTDTAGSGRVPAAFNNIVGLKPSRGLISAAGVVPACKSLDCVSIFALSCHDAREVLKVATGYDGADVYSRRHEDLPPADRLLNLSGLRFGIPSQKHLRFFGNIQVEACYHAAVERLKKLGGVAVEIDYEPFHRAASLLYDGPWIAERLAAIKDFVANNAEGMLPVTRGIINGARRFDAVAAFEGQYELQSLRQATRHTWQQVDVLLLPTAGSTYTVAEVEADPIALNINLGYYTNFVNLLDLCALAVPGSFGSNGLPTGITLVTTAGHESSLLVIGDAIHRAAHVLMGGTGYTLPGAEVVESFQPTGVKLAVVGAHLTGQPLNFQLRVRDAKLLRTCQTAPCYQLFALPNTLPPKPGLIRVEKGASIEVEIWEMTHEAFGGFVAAIPPPMGIGTLLLEDGESVKGFITEPYAVTNAQDISHFGGWRKFLAGA